MLNPKSLSDLERLFEGEGISSSEFKNLLQEFQASYNREERGVLLEQIKKGWQFRTKTENKSHLLKARPKAVFRLSKPALEALSIIAYKQACSKNRSGGNSRSGIRPSFKNPYGQGFDLFCRQK